MSRQIDFIGLADVRVIAQDDIVDRGLTDPGEDLIWDRDNNYSLVVAEDIAVFLLSMPTEFEDDALNTMGDLIAVYSEAATVIAAAGTALELDLSVGTVFYVTLDQASCEVSFVNPPAAGREVTAKVRYTQGSGGGKEITHDVAVLTPSGVPVELSVAAGKIDELIYTISNAGATILVDTKGQDYVVES